MSHASSFTLVRRPSSSHPGISAFGPRMAVLVLPSTQEGGDAITLQGRSLRDIATSLVVLFRTGQRDPGAYVWKDVSFASADLRGIALRVLGAEAIRQMDLRGANLSGQDLSGLDLQGVRMEEAILYGTSFRNARLEGARFTGARIGQQLQIDQAGGAPSFRGAPTDFSGAALPDDALATLQIRGKVVLPSLPHAEDQPAPETAPKPGPAITALTKLQELVEQAMPGANSSLFGSPRRPVPAARGGLQRAGLA